MKKLVATLIVFLMVFAVTAQAEEANENVFTFRNGVTFKMDIPAVMETESGHAEIDNEDTRGGIEFTKAEYEDVTENGVKADLEYLFIGNCLIAVRVSYDEGRMNYDSLMKDLTSKYGEAAAVDTAVLGNGIYVLDDDGRLKPDTMAFTSGDLMVIVEREKDDDGDEIAITYLDMTAAYITVK